MKITDLRENENMSWCKPIKGTDANGNEAIIVLNEGEIIKAMVNGKEVPFITGFEDKCDMGCAACPWIGECDLFEQ